MPSESDDIPSDKYIVRIIEFVIRVGAGTVNVCLVLNYCDKRHI
jgi:hypothetical protein